MDMKKSYDSIEWSFVDEMLKDLHFPSRFIGWLMECLCTPRYSLMVNGGLFWYFEGKRGLRQGDPVSPLLFLVCMEYLTRTLRIVGEKADFKFHPRCSGVKMN